MVGMLYTGRIYDHKKIRQQLPDARLICVMRRPWRYCPSDIPKLVSLGPPIDLHNETREAVENGYDGPEFKMSYSARYMAHLLLGDGEECPEDLTQKILHDVRGGSDIVLLCHEKAGEFCHRKLLYHFLISCLGPENAGGETPKPL